MPMPDATPSLPVPRVVGIGRGKAWLGEGFGLFRLAAGTWIGMLLIWLALSIVLEMTSLDVAGPFLNPIFNAGLMIGCASLARGQGLRVEHLFAGFRSGRVATLLMMTVWTLLIGLCALLALSLALWLPVVGPLLALGDRPTPENVLGAIGLGGAMMLILAVSLVVVLVAMATWFAPALIVLRRVPALDALKLSLRASIMNWQPFLIYGLIAMAMLIVAAIPLLLGLLIAIPVLFASVYAGYRDIFPEPAA